MAGMEHDIIGLSDGRVLQTHSPSMCQGEFCCVHNPSDHPLKDAPLNWRSDRHLMERICDHGIGHPDPDGLAFRRRVLPTNLFTSLALAIHGCDGCCWQRRADTDS